jgi:hypothetical protein
MGPSPRPSPQSFNNNNNNNIIIIISCNRAPPKSAIVALCLALWQRSVFIPQQSETAPAVTIDRTMGEIKETPRFPS